MDIILNDGTRVFNVTPSEYMELQKQGLVGQAHTANLYEYTLDNLHKCWKCGCTIDASNAIPSIPPMHECKKCRDAWARKVAEVV